MIPYVIPQLPLLFGTVLLLLIAIGSLECGVNRGENHYNCEMSKVKSVELYHTLSKKYLRINNNSLVVADAEIFDKHTLYTITIIEHGFLIYDPEESMFICLKRGRNKFKLIARRNPKMLKSCVFVENSVVGQFTKYEWYMDNKYVLSFNKRGLPRINNSTTEAQKFTKKLTNCSLAYKTFCGRMKSMYKIHSNCRNKPHKIRRKIHVYENFKELCN